MLPLIDLVERRERLFKFREHERARERAYGRRGDR